MPSILRLLGYATIFVLLVLIAIQMTGLLAQFRPAVSTPSVPTATSFSCRIASPASFDCACPKRTACVCRFAESKDSAPLAMTCTSDSRLAAPVVPMASSTGGSSNAADVLSTLSLVIAVVTLLLTVGSTYLAARQEQLAKLIDRDHQRDRLQLALVRAQAELLPFFKAAGAPDPVEAAALVGAQLACLRTPLHQQRRDICLQIASYLGPSAKAALPETGRYIMELENWIGSSPEHHGQLADVDFFRVADTAPY